MPDLLTLSNVTVRFGGLTALSDISLSLRQHSSLGLLGPNGAGKTTLFNVIAGAVRPTQGRVDFDGRDVTTSSRVRFGRARTFLFSTARSVNTTILAPSRTDLW